MAAMTPGSLTSHILISFSTIAFLASVKVASVPFSAGLQAANNISIRSTATISCLYRKLLSFSLKEC